jgi:hypothetical protein
VSGEQVGGQLSVTGERDRQVKRWGQVGVVR